MKLALVFAAAAHAATITRWHTASAVLVTVYETTTFSTQPPATTQLTSEELPTSAAPTSTKATFTTSTEPTSSSVSTSLSTSSTWVPTTLSTVTASSTSSSSSSSAAASSSATLDAFESAILAEHNTKRALHSAPALTWNTKLAEYAADYAASSFDCDNVKLVHSGGSYGENLAAGYVGGAAPVDAWYNEISDYDFSNPGYSESTGHFTQLVWKSTTQLGCARVMCDNAWRQYTICEYSPAGNVVGTTSALTAKYFSENVLES